jgi:polysaccharide export outer membrane protein
MSLKNLEFNISSTILILILFSSCASSRDITYLQFDKLNSEQINNDYQLKFKSDDLLQIVVSSEDFESVQPFNMPVVGFLNVGNSQYSTSQALLQSYLIDSEGYIDFPVIGRIKLRGLTRIEAIDFLKSKLSPKYLINPIINLNISNFKVTVEGDVNKPGTYPIRNERLSIFDALGLAGDLQISARRDNVLLVREENGVKNTYRVDLRSNKVFNSPAYYIQQNDFIYIEPNLSKVQDASYTRTSGLLISLSSVVISLITIITR